MLYVLKLLILVWSLLVFAVANWLLSMWRNFCNLSGGRCAFFFKHSDSFKPQSCWRTSREDVDVKQPHFPLIHLIPKPRDARTCLRSCSKYRFFLVEESFWFGIVELCKCLINLTIPLRLKIFHNERISQPIVAFKDSSGNLINGMRFGCCLMCSGDVFWWCVLVRFHSFKNFLEL